MAASTLQDEALLRVSDWVEAKTLMYRHTPALTQAKSAVQSAEADEERAMAQLMPSMQVGVGTGFSPIRPWYNRNYVLDRHQFMAAQSLIPAATAGVSFRFSLGALRQLRSSEAGVKAQQHELTAQRHGLLLSLASAVLDVVAAERLYERYEAGLTAAKKRLQMTQRMFELGRATKLDENRFAQDAHEAEQLMVQGKTALWEAREALGSALGVASPATVGADFDLQVLLGDPRVSGCSALASVEQRPDVLAVKERARQAKLSLEAARLSYLPELQFDSSYQASYANTTALTVGGGGRDLLHNWVANVNLVWTIFDGARSAAVSQQQAALVGARAEQRAMQLEVAKQKRDADRMVRLAAENLDIAERDLVAARKADELARRSFELGKVSALEGVDAARRLRAAEITQALRDMELLFARTRQQLITAVCR